MKKLIAVSPVVLFILYSFIPFLYLIGIIGGYTLKLRFGEELIAAFGILSLVIFFNVSEYPLEMDKTNIILSTLLLPLALLTGLCVVGYCKSVSSTIFSFVCVVCAFHILSISTVNPTVGKLYKLVATVLSILLGAYSLFMIMSGNTSAKRSTLLSPGGTYTAEIATVDGYSTVDIYETERRVELVLFYYDDIPQMIGIDHKPGVDRIEVFFADENTLVIDGTSYPIK